MEPRFWIAFSFLTMTFLRDMKTAPLERQTVTIIGSISGVRPTATERPKRRASSQSCLVIPTMRKVTETMTSMKRTMSLTKALVPLSKSVAPLGSDRSAATLPRKVLIPVFTAMPRAAPETTVLPWKQQSLRSKMPAAAESRRGDTSRPAGTRR